jgi:hypothetical protein
VEILPEANAGLPANGGLAQARDQFGHLPQVDTVESQVWRAEVSQGHRFRTLNILDEGA